MVLHLGDDFFVPMADVVLITPYNEALKNEDTAAFLNSMETECISDANKPKSAVIVDEGGRFKAYISPISAATLFKRGVKNNR